MIDIQLINKNQIIDQIVSQLEVDLDSAIDAATRAHDAATHEQSKAETQYDTLGLEHAYLAEGQSRRIQQLKADIVNLNNLNCPDLSQDDEIVLGALIEILIINENKEEQKSVFFMVNSGGGYGATFDKDFIQAVTPKSPLGNEMLGIGIDDEFMFSQRRYRICQIR